MEERKKHKVMIGIEVVLLCMLVAILGTNAASSNPPSNGVSYGKNNQTTVEGALNDLYNKANYGNASAGQILKGKTALVGGKKVTGTMEDRGLAQYGSWGCGDAGCGSGNDAYYAINALPEGYYHSDGNTWAPEARINANTLRSSLGITADKILEGQSIAGVTGTGKTSCPTCESQGYYKIKKFEKIKAGVASYQGFDGKWKHLAYRTEYGCQGGGCDAYSGETEFTVNLNSDLGIQPTEIIDYALTLSCNVEDGIRFNRGYNKDSSTITYWYPQELTISSSGGLIRWWTGSSTANTQKIEPFNTKSTIGMMFSVSKGSYGNGTANSTFETKCTEFYLSGSITYR